MSITLRLTSRWPGWALLIRFSSIKCSMITGDEIKDEEAEVVEADTLLSIPHRTLMDIHSKME